MLTTIAAEQMGRAKRHHAAGRLDEAAQEYAGVLEALPEHVDAWCGLAAVAFARGDRARARGLIERALAIDVEAAVAYRVLGAIDEAEGRLRAAYVAYARACAIDSAQPAVLLALARVALLIGRTSESIAAAHAAIAGGADDAGLLRVLGAAQALRGDYPAAVAALDASLRLEPHPDALAHLAACALAVGRVDDAMTACAKALELDPAHASATLHRGIAALTSGDIEQALAAFERAIALGCEEAHINLGRLALLLGDYQTGLPHFGWDDPRRRALPVFGALPMWDGVRSPGKRLLVWHEQGVGDTIAMARFLRAARDRVGHLALACPRGTEDVFRSVDGVDAVVAGYNAVGFDSYDFWLPTIRLPVILNVRARSLPNEPYVRADPDRIERFRPLLDVPARLRVGLVWSGNPQFARNEWRSCGLRALGPLNDVPDIAWFALQQGRARAESAPDGMRLIPINASVADYADTAAIIEHLDLVITVDTSVANLAGALGRPAWVLLAKLPDWRWGLEANVSPWYPSLRLFRQRVAGGWDAVIAAVATELGTLTR